MISDAGMAGDNSISIEGLSCCTPPRLVTASRILARRNEQRIHPWVDQAALIYPLDEFFPGPVDLQNQSQTAEFIRIKMGTDPHDR